METLAEQQAEAAQAAQAVHEGLASQVQSVSTQLGSFKETLAGLEATASSHPGLWQAAVAEATGPLHEQVCGACEPRKGKARATRAAQSNLWSGAQSTCAVCGRPLSCTRFPKHKAPSRLANPFPPAPLPRAGISGPAAAVGICCTGA